MKINRREVLFAGGLSLLTRALVPGQTAAPAGARPDASRGPEARLLEALQRNRLPLTMGDTPAGSGWDWLVREAKAARFTLIGEEHGVAETAQFSAALWLALRGSGYGRMAIELSPPIAEFVETAARRDGLKGIEDLLKTPGLFTFYNLREEAKFLADVIKAAAATKGNERVLWGLDREVFSDRYLISRLETRVPQRARAAVTRLKQASANAWTRYGQTRNPDDMFLLAEDPALVSAVRVAWPDPDNESDSILRTLEESLAIETAERTGGMWPYMQRRTKWNRDNFAARLKEEQGRKVPPKVLMKFGLNHMVRGANYVNVFDLGAMADEVAALTGDRAFHIIVLPSPGSRQAVPGAGRSFGSVATDDFDDFNARDGRLTRMLPNSEATGHEVIDLRALRPTAMRGLEGWNPDVIRTIYGYDAALIWKAAHASSGLE
ncbi:MAG TPA: hypothetical protein VL572_00415 [Pyrinomonadaceae bacterium]|nr:hypothetical protein [Pyrinomonadaceae bacterium]